MFISGATSGTIAASALFSMRFILAFVFARAGVAKLGNLEDFRTAIINYEIVPAGIVKLTAISIPVVEVAAGCLLLIGVLPGITSAAFAALLAIFSAAIAVNLARGRSFDCGCGGTAPRVISWRHVISNSLFALSAITLLIVRPSGLILVSGPGGPFSAHTPSDAELPLILAVVLGLIVVSIMRSAYSVYRPVGIPAKKLISSHRGIG